MKNKYEIRGDITAIFIKSRKYGNLEALISTCKLEMVSEFPGTWYACRNYVIGNMPKVNGRYNGKKVLHRWIANAPEGMVVDHINHDTLDNTDDNLRAVTHAENHQNRKGARRNSSSGVRGVSWNKRENKWIAYITVNQKTHHLGYFKNVEKAKKVVEEAREKMMPFSKEAYKHAN